MLGKGHDGMCYLCEDLENRELVAVKVLNPKRNRKVTEPVLMAGLDHKHIIRMRDHFMVRGFNFLVIDYCDKGDLCDYVYENEYLDEAEARKILLQLVKGVRYLHDRGICHRDLKLDNIFIDKDSNVRIGDFGASCRFDQETKLTYRCGTTQYNAPELVKNQGYFGDEVDCWALGIILYVMLIGKFPFDCDTDMQLLWQVLKGIKFPERPQLSPGVKDLIRSLTEPQPSQRATLQAILEHPWMQPAIKADPFFERDEEEAALNAEQARSMRSTLPPQHLDDDADVDDKHGKSSATATTTAAAATTTAAVATSSSKAQSHLASSATSTATAVSTSISSSNSSSSSSVGGGGSGVGERADGSVAATTREASPTRAAPAPPTPSLPPPALPLKPTPLLSSSSSSSSTVEDVKKD